ncbi:hypothetical protein V2J09_014438 [Rumex salicifolius]
MKKRVIDARMAAPMVALSHTNYLVLETSYPKGSESGLSTPLSHTAGFTIAHARGLPRPHYPSLTGVMSHIKREKSRLGVITSHLTSDSSMASEKEAALAAAAAPPPVDSPTIFDKIISKEIPANVVYEDDQVLAFRDIAPQAPTHIVVIPKVKDGLTGLSKAEERHCEILGRLLYTAKLVAKQEGLDDGYRVVINDGPNGCQSVFHIHVHVIGGRQMNWPPG